ncbi:MAG: EAL domain-containing protein [Nitrospirae bacterium]|nr:EAL domain-containing protein [Nitrospirota bacterium]
MRISISKKIVILLFVMTFIGSMELLLIYYYQSLQKDDARIINLSGSQRMLTQEISKYALLVARGNYSYREFLRNAVKQYDSNLQILYKGGILSDYKIPPAPDEMRALYENNISQWTAFKKSAEKIADESSFDDALHYILQENTSLRDIGSDITHEYEVFAQQKNVHLKVILLILTTVDLFIFLIGTVAAYKLIRPLSGIAKFASEIGEGNFLRKIPLPEADNEIKDLAAAFNKMTHDLHNTVISREYLNSVINTMGEMLFVIDAAGVIKVTNSAVNNLLGYEFDELANRYFYTLSCESKDAVEDRLKEVHVHGTLGNIETFFTTKDERKVAVLCSFSTMKKSDSNGNDGDIVCVATDVTERQHYEKELRKLSIAVEHSISSILITDTNGNIEFVNQKFTESTGYTLAEVKGRNPRIFKSNLHGPDFYKRFWDEIKSGREFRSDMCNRKKNGEFYWQHVSVSPIKDQNGNITHFLSVTIDDIERRRAEERLKQLAHYDMLTGLPNRSLFEDRLEQTILQAKRFNFTFAIAFLDLDGFKLVNDTYGHNTGDLLLKEVAIRLSNAVRNSDTVARMGGDEFQILLSKITQPSDAASVVKKIISSINEPFFINGQKCAVGVSTGISIFPNDGDSIEVLTKNADLAMYKVKEHGKNNYMFYEHTMDVVLDRINIESALKRAISENEFLLYYQPQIDINNGKSVGCESLIRWKHPEIGLISPDKFIPIAEETGLIVQIGKWVTRTACMQNKKWLDMGLPVQRISVNLSTLQFKQIDLVQMITNILKETGMPAEYLGIEITESGVMQDVDESVRMMNEFKKLHVKITIDDFGTGYSSMYYLKRFPVDILKIDQNFIKNCTTNPTDAVITSTIISMAHSLNIRVIAEGVETVEQLELLRTFNCDEVQGYIFSKPVPAADFTELLEEEHVFNEKAYVLVGKSA